MNRNDIHYRPTNRFLSSRLRKRWAFLPAPSRVQAFHFRASPVRVLFRLAVDSLRREVSR